MSAERKASGHPDGTPSRYVVEDVGRRLRALRRERGLTIMQLAELSGVPASTISKIENRQLRPSLVNGINLASALNENLGFLVDRFRGPAEKTRIVRSADRSVISYGEIGLTLEDLRGSYAPGILEARIGRLAEGAHSGLEAMTHPGEEFAMVLAGSIQYRIGEAVHDLAAGDYIQFKSDIRHSWANTSRGETRMLWVFSDGLSF